jgi:hypothetical protein
MDEATSASGLMALDRKPLEHFGSHCTGVLEKIK